MALSSKMPPTYKRRTIKTAIVTHIFEMTAEQVKDALVVEMAAKHNVDLSAPGTRGDVTISDRTGDAEITICQQTTEES